MPPKLHLNEHLSPRLAQQLRSYGFDVTSTLEMKMVEADDDEQLAYAASSGRAIVTFNHKDFSVRHDVTWRQEWNIGELSFRRKSQWTVMRRRLLKLLNTVSADELKNQTRWLNDFK